MPDTTVTIDTATSTQRLIGWIIRDGFEITVVTHAPAQPAG